MFSLVSTKFHAMRNITLYSVGLSDLEYKKIRPKTFLTSYSIMLKFLYKGKSSPFSTIGIDFAHSPFTFLRISKLLQTSFRIWDTFSLHYNKTSENCQRLDIFHKNRMFWKSNTVGEIQTTSSQERSSPQDKHTRFCPFCGLPFHIIQYWCSF